jgi:hypothetical protein
MREWCCGETEVASGRSGAASSDAVTWAAPGQPAGDPAALLAQDLRGAVERGRRHRLRRVHAGGHAVVPRSWRHDHQSPLSHRRGAICRLPRARRSRCCGAQRCGVREVARRLGRSPSTISRELRRNAATRGGGLEYWASTAQWHAERRARRPKTAKLAVNDTLRQYVQDRLAGTVTAPDGSDLRGPAVRWIGRRHGRREDRRWACSWSPEQIANRLRVDFPHDESMRISHEAIYQALYAQGRGALRRELTACLRAGRALRVPRARTRGRGKTFVTPEVMISQRPVPARSSAGEHPPRLSTITYPHCRQAVLHRPLEPEQDTLTACVTACQRLGLRRSMSRTGSCWTTPLPRAGSRQSLKVELVHRQHDRTRAQARTAIFRWIACTTASGSTRPTAACHPPRGNTSTPPSARYIDHGRIAPLSTSPGEVHRQVSGERGTGRYKQRRSATRANPGKLGDAKPRAYLAGWRQGSRAAERKAPPSTPTRTTPTARRSGWRWRSTSW